MLTKKINKRNFQENGYMKQSKKKQSNKIRKSEKFRLALKPILDQRPETRVVFSPLLLKSFRHLFHDAMHYIILRSIDTIFFNNIFLYNLLKC